MLSARCRRAFPVQLIDEEAREGQTRRIQKGSSMHVDAAHAHSSSKSQPKPKVAGTKQKAWSVQGNAGSMQRARSLLFERVEQRRENQCGCCLLPAWRQRAQHNAKNAAKVK